MLFAVTELFFLHFDFFILMLLFSSARNLIMRIIKVKPPKIKAKDTPIYIRLNILYVNLTILSKNVFDYANKSDDFEVTEIDNIRNDDKLMLHMVTTEVGGGEVPMHTAAVSDASVSVVAQKRHDTSIGSPTRKKSRSTKKDARKDFGAFLNCLAKILTDLSPNLSS